jgi:hypothetical protein
LEVGESGAPDAVVDAGEEAGVTVAGVGDGVAEGSGDALDQAVGAEASEVVGHSFVEADKDQDLEIDGCQFVREGDRPW